MDSAYFTIVFLLALPFLVFVIWLLSNPPRAARAYTDMSRVFVGIFAILVNMTKAWILFLVPKAWSWKKKLNKETVLITGGGRGLGRALAIKLARAGCEKIVIWDLAEKALEEAFYLIEKEGAKCYPYVVDVSKHEQVSLMAEKVYQEAGRVTMLINNAGVVMSGTLLDLPPEKIERTFAVNTLAHFWVCLRFSF